MPRPLDHTEMAGSVLFSIVVPMRNEEWYVRETVQSLLDQELPAEACEILVVDGGSTDRSREIVANLARTHGNIRLLDNPLQRSAPARNVGVRAARGRYIGIVDCHSFVKSDFLTTAARLFEETGADCLGRPVELFIPADSYLQRAIGAARTSWLGHNMVSPRYSSERGAVSPLSVGIVYRRQVFDSIGLFNESLGACEDVEFNHRLQRAGMRTWTDPALLCWYHPRPSFVALFRQLERYGYWRYRLLRTEQRAFHISQAAPAGATVLALTSVAGAMAGWIPAAVPISLAGLYLAVLILASARAARRRGLRYLPLLPVAFAAIHAGAAVGFTRGALSEVPAAVSRVAGRIAATLRVARGGRST